MNWSAARGVLGENVGRLHKAKRLSQERLAELTELDQPHISGIEAGLINLTLENFQALAVALSALRSAEAASLKRGNFGKRDGQPAGPAMRIS
jgi:transcriptional regulator with XRE-family HTH domain